MNEKIKTKAEEGVRSAAVLLAQVDDGALNAEFSERLHETVQKLYEHAVETAKDAKGRVSLTLDLAVSEKGFVGLRGTVETKIPKRKASLSHFWISPGGNLTVENPRQQKLPLREVAGNAATHIDLPADQATRTV